MDNFIPVNEPLLNGNEKKYLNECIDTGWISSEGPFVKKLEKDFSAYTGQKYGSCVANGSVAIDAAVRAMKEVYGWQDGDEVILPDFTIISTAQSLIYNKLKPVFVDADPKTWNIDVTKIEETITSKSKAIMVVHIYGIPTDMEPVFKLAEKYNLRIIEDAAQAHGLKYNDRICGGMSDISTFSFYANKHIACGEGGLIMTSNDDLIEKVNYFKNLCFSKDRFIHNDLGWNFRMSNLQAAVAYAQFERLESFIEKKKEMGKIYREAFKNLPVQMAPSKTFYADNNYWVFGMVINDDVKFDAKEAMTRLAQKGIGCRPFFYPLHKQPVLQKMGLSGNEEYPVSARLYERGFYIPSGLGLTNENQQKVIDEVKKLFSEQA